MENPSHLHSSSANCLNVDRVGSSASRTQQLHKNVRGVAVQCKQIQTRWPSKLEKNDDNTKLIHLNGNNNNTSNTRNIRRRRSSGGNKSVDIKHECKGETRSQRKCRSNEFHPIVRRSDCDPDNARDSDTNLLIENMRNRECELINKISANNGYYCCSSSENDDFVQLIRRQNSYASVCDVNDKRRSSATKPIRNNIRTSLEGQRKMTILNHCAQKGTRGSVIQYQTESGETMKKLKFTITINRNYEKQTAGFQRIELEPNSTPNLTTKHDPLPVIISDTSENCNTTTNSSANGEYDDLSSSISTIDLDKSAEYYDCCETNFENQSVTISSTCSSLSVYEDALEQPADEPVIQMANSKIKTVSIVQELTADNTLQSTVTVDTNPHNRAEETDLSQTLNRKSKQKRFTIIGDNFFNEVFRSIDQRNIILNEDSKNSACTFEPIVDDNYSITSLGSSQQSDNVVATKLGGNPKYNGKSIGRLLAKRLERNQALSEKRKMLLRTMAEANKAPPAKPPRSFTSLSSPSSNKSSDGVISATTVPIGEIIFTEGLRTHKEYFEPRFSEIQSYRNASTQIGWVTANKDMSNNGDFGWTSPKATEIVFSPTDTSENGFGWATAETFSRRLVAPQNNEMEPKIDPYHSQLLGMLNYEKYHTRNEILTTNLQAQPQFKAVMPLENIDTVDSSVYFQRFSNKSIPSSTPVKPKDSPPQVPGHAVPSAPEQNVLLSPNPKDNSGKKSNAMARTKTFLGASKKFLKKPLKHATISRSPHNGNPLSNEKSKKNGDDTAKFNSEDFDSQNYDEKKTIKHLGFTPKKDSPPRHRAKCEQNLARNSAPTKISSGDTKKSATVLVKLNRITKTPRKMLLGFSSKRSTSDSGLNRSLPSEHFYMSFTGPNGQVPLMRELLGDFRQKITGEEPHISPARRSLRFQDQYASSVDITDVSNRIVEIDLHDEPEPLYAEVGQQSPQPPSRPPSFNTSNAVQSPVDFKEIYITNGNESEPPRKYIMVNNDPSVLYATVNNKPNASSTESLDINIINNFADSVQNMIDEKFLDTTHDRPTSRTRRSTVKSPSVYFSGIESIDSEVDEILGNNSPSDITSLDTFQTENLYETIISERDLNDEIKNDIQSLERSPTIFEEMSDLEDDSFGFDEKCGDVRYRDGQRQDSKHELREQSFGRDTVDSEIQSTHADVNYARGINSLASSQGAKPVKRSPSYKEMKHKIRNSVKKGTNYLKQEGRKFSELLENSLLKSDKKNVGVSPRKNRMPININKYVQSQISETLDLSDNKVQKLIGQIKKQVEIQDDLRNAIAFCRSTNEFSNSTELVEAECLGLISKLKETSAINELDLVNAKSDPMDDNGSSKAGHVKINNIRFSLKDKIYKDTQFNYFYLCVCIYRGEVQTTVVKERNSSQVVFNNCKIEFNELDPKFNIYTEVYALSLRKSRFQSGSEESPIVGKLRKTGVVSPSEIQCDSVCAETTDETSDISMFKLLASAVLTSFDLCSQAQPKSLALSPPSQRNYFMKSKKSVDFSMVVDRNHLSHVIEVDFQTEIVFHASSLTGFLNIADCNLNWNRRWCSLDEFHMKFWNYPQDFNVMSPILEIALSKSACENEITIANRETCARPRSFVIDIIYRNSAEDRQIQRYYISTDTMQELQLWLAEINRVIAFCRDWHIE